MGSNPTGGVDVCCECCVLSGRGLCDELITRPEESYRLWCVVACDLETSWMRRPWPTGGCRAKTNNQPNKQIRSECRNTVWVSNFRSASRWLSIDKSERNTYDIWMCAIRVGRQHWLVTSLWVVIWEVKNVGNTVGYYRQTSPTGIFVCCFQNWHNICLISL